MEEAREEKQESIHCNENFSNSDEQKDQRKSDTSPNSDESEENLKTLYNNELEGNPNESKPVWSSEDGVANEKFDCKVCGKEFRSIKALHGHMRVHSGKKRAAEVESNGGEEKPHSLRPKKQASIKFKPPRAPDSGIPQKPFSNGGSHGGEASSSSAVERERSSSEREVEVSDPELVQAPAYHPEPDPVELDAAQTLLILSTGENDPNIKSSFWVEILDIEIR